MPEELSLAIQQICDEKRLSLEAVKETIEEALAAAFRKDFGDKKTQNIKVDFDLKTGNFEVFDIKEVVADELKEKYDKLHAEIEALKEAGEDITEKLQEMKGETEAAPGAEGEEVEVEKKFNPRTMISLSEAQVEKKSANLGDEIIKKLEVPADFGRMAAQTAKQVIIQKIREAERSNIFAEFNEKIGELIVGTVQRQEDRVVLVDLGLASALLLPQDQSKSDKYIPGARMKFYVKSVEQTNKGPEILISRSHPEMLRKLFKLEVPEINSGAVQIKAISRDAGFRAKVAVMAKEEDLDPIGACIGQRGTRVQAIINEISGEKIDVIEWDENQEKFITNALAPAKILSIQIDEESKTAKAFVKEDQYSLAIGKGGQNVRLAAQLVGMKIDVVMEGQADKEKVLDEEDNKQDKDEAEVAADKTSSDDFIEEEKAEKSEDGKEPKVEKKAVETEVPQETAPESEDSKAAEKKSSKVSKKINTEKEKTAGKAKDKKS